MQLKIKVYLDTPLVLPIAYHHILQSALYKLMGGDGGTSLHDGGYSDKNKVFKFFTFGPIKGKYSLDKGKITFFNEISFEFRCAEDKYAGMIAGNIASKGICFGEKAYRNVEVRSSDYRINREAIRIKMCSAITVYGTDFNGKTFYYRPEEIEFVEGVLNNIKRKYRAYTGEEYSGNIGFEVVRAGLKDKYMTRYKGFIIEGYKGEYRLKGDYDLLNLLYNVGIGAKCSQGFGMFDVIG